MVHTARLGFHVMWLTPPERLSTSFLHSILEPHFFPKRDSGGLNLRALVGFCSSVNSTSISQAFSTSVGQAIQSEAPRQTITDSRVILFGRTFISAVYARCSHLKCLYVLVVVRPQAGSASELAAFAKCSDELWGWRDLLPVRHREVLPDALPLSIEISKLAAIASKRSGRSPALEALLRVVEKLALHKGKVRPAPSWLLAFPSIHRTIACLVIVLSLPVECHRASGADECN